MLAKIRHKFPIWWNIEGSVGVLANEKVRAIRNKVEQFYSGLSLARTRPQFFHQIENFYGEPVPVIGLARDKGNYFCRFWKCIVLIAFSESKVIIRIRGITPISEIPHAITQT